mmetsp:Transcript_7860/g.20167  ORF Transcript_7860/g.20167 Transcript_7860/m.20167 type:complete len:213 (+) Transcript_7860:229-867(+)
MRGRWVLSSYVPGLSGAARQRMYRVHIGRVPKGLLPAPLPRLGKPRRGSPMCRLQDLVWPWHVPRWVRRQHGIRRHSLHDVPQHLRSEPVRVRRLLRRNCADLYRLLRVLPDGTVHQQGLQQQRHFANRVLSLYVPVRCRFLPFGPVRRQDDGECRPVPSVQDRVSGRRVQAELLLGHGPRGRRHVHALCRTVCGGGIQVRKLLQRSYGKGH